MYISTRAALSAGMRVLGYAKFTLAHQLEKEGAIAFADRGCLPTFYQ